MKKVFFLITILAGLNSQAQSFYYVIKNLNSSGPGSFREIADSLENAPFFASGYLKFDDNLSGTVTLDRPLKIQNMTNFTFNGSPTVDVKFSGVDTAIIISKIDIATLSYLNSSANAKVVMRNCDITAIRYCETKWVHYLRDNDISSVTGGFSAGTNTNRVADIRITDHSVWNGNFFANLTNATVNNVYQKRITITNCKLGLKPDDTKYFNWYYGIRVENCKNTYVDISGNEIVSIGVTGSGTSAGKGIHFTECSGQISIKKNYFGISKSGNVTAALPSDAVHMQMIGDSSNVSIDSNYFHTCNTSAIHLEGLDDTTSIKGNKIAYSSLAASFSEAIILNNCANVVVTDNEIGKGFANAVSLKSSSNNYFSNNLIGLIDNGGSYLEALPSSKSGVLIDASSNNNSFKANYIVGHGRYGIENFGNNDVAFNYVACNDSANFYYDKKIGSHQSTLNAAILKYNVSGSGQPISLTMTGLDPLNGFKAHIYKKATCSNYTKADLQKTYIDSINITAGVINYAFPIAPTKRINRTSAANDIYYLVFMDSQFNLVGTSTDSETNMVLSANQVEQKSIDAYPNPSSGLITVSEAVLAIYSATGEVIQVPSGANFSLNLAPGLYFIQYQSGRSEKVVVR